jgi:hypothetical protein
MLGRLLGLFALCLLLAGCAGPRGAFRRALRTDFVAAAHPQDLAALYQVHTPDVLEVRVTARPDCCGRRAVRIEGEIDLAPGEPLRVGGLPARQIAARIAKRLRVPESQVEVRVAEHNSQSLYLFSDDGGAARVIPYRGPETVLDLFRRLPAQARLADGEVHVVRSHVADGNPPEVFRVDLRAILLREDLQTNVRLEPFDRIVIGQSRRARVLGQMPPWVRRAFGPREAPPPAQGGAAGAPR